MILFITILISAFLAYYLILSPLIQLLKIKLQFGKYAYLNFIPILGDFYEIQASNRKFQDRFELFRKYFRDNQQIKFLLMNIYNIPLIIVGDPEYIRVIHQNHDNYKKFDFYNYNTKFLSQGLIFSTGEQWKFQRCLLSKPFNYDELKSRVPLINQIVKENLEKNQTFKSILGLTRAVTGNVVIQSFFGEEIKDSKINGKYAYEEILDLFDDLGEIIFGTLYGFLRWVILGEYQWKLFPTSRERDIDKRSKQLSKFAEDVVDKRIMDIQKNGFKNNENDADFLDIHLKELFKADNQSKLNKDQIISQFITLFFVGTDTTSSLTIMCLLYLCQYKDAYEAILNEIYSVVGETDDVTDQHLPKLRIMTSFIWELLRFKNPVSGPVIRVDLKVKKGWMILPANYVQQTSEKYFDQCYEFDYRRFLNQNPIKNDNGFVHIPFSAGPRNCIGQHMAMIEIKIMLCHILRKYDIVADEEKMKKITWKSKLLYLFDPIDCIKLVKKQ